MTSRQLDRSVRAQLRTLSKENAEGVGAHLVMVAQLLDTNIQAAEAHAETAVRRAGRVPAAREALGLVAYRKGDWARALNEFRTARRLSGSSHLLPLMVDCERGLGRPDKALDLATKSINLAADASERTRQKVVEVSDATHRYVQEKPGKALLLAAAAGAFVALLLNRGGRR